MKKLMVWSLVLVLMCAGLAQAAEWSDGRSPSQPYVGVPEVNLNEIMGYMMFYPSAKMTKDYACQRLFIYLPREDVKAGKGTLYLVDQDANQQVWSTTMNNTAAVRQRPITDAELTSLLWGGGTCFEIRLPKTLAVGKNYFVNMTRECIVSNDGKVDNPEVGGTTAWAINIGGQFGVSNMEYRRPNGDGTYQEQLLTPQVGDEIRFDLVLGGEAAMAVVYAYNDSVDFIQQTYTESCEVIGSVTGDTIGWGVTFLDAAGNPILDMDDPVLDEDGNPVLDDEGNPTYYAVRVEFL